jgi:hypothetical protein
MDVHPNLPESCWLALSASQNSGEQPDWHLQLAESGGWVVFPGAAEQGGVDGDVGGFDATVAHAGVNRHQAQAPGRWAQVGGQRVGERN